MNNEDISKLYNRYDYYILSVAAIILLLFGTTFYHYIEHWRWLDSLYFCVITLLTIGYGDFTPKTDPAKIFTIFYVAIGISILGAFIQSFIRRAAQRQKERLHKRLNTRIKET